MNSFDLVRWFSKAKTGDKMSLEILEAADELSSYDDWDVRATTHRFRLTINSKVVIAEMRCYDSWDEFCGELEFSEVKDGEIT